MSSWILTPTVISINRNMNTLCTPHVDLLIIEIWFLNCPLKFKVYKKMFQKTIKCNHVQNKIEYHSLLLCSNDQTDL